MLLWEEKHHFPEIPILSKIKFRWQLTVKCQFSDVTSSTSKFVLVSDKWKCKNQPFPEHLMDNEVHLFIHSLKLINIPGEPPRCLAPWRTWGFPGRKTDRQTDTHTHTQSNNTAGGVLLGEGSSADSEQGSSRRKGGPVQVGNPRRLHGKILEGFMEEARFLQVDCRHWCKYIARLKSIPSRYGEGWVYRELRVAREQLGKSGSKWAQD